MLRYLLPHIDFQLNSTHLFTCGLYDGDRIAYNYLPEDIIQEIEYMELSYELSFILIDTQSLSLIGFILVKEENLGNRPNGVRIHSIGYSNENLFNHIIGILKISLNGRRNHNTDRLYEYVWGYENEDFTLLAPEFNIHRQNGYFISELY